METIKDLKTIPVQTIANYILKHFGPMSHLKLQKLLFYSQAYHLGYFQSPLIEEEFQAWIHGPVCKEVYNNQKEQSVLHADIRFNPEKEADPDKGFEEILCSSQKELLSDILTELSTWTGLELENATHNEDPWVLARKGYGSADRCENIITKESMMTYYGKEING